MRGDILLHGKSISSAGGGHTTSSELDLFLKKSPLPTCGWRPSTSCIRDSAHFRHPSSSKTGYYFFSRFKPWPIERHQVIHTGERPYICDIYGEAFKYKTNLNSHRKLHSGEKPYICEECGKAFAHLDYLKEYIKTYSGKKPYVCNICNKAYTNRRSLKRYIETEHQKIRYACDYCGKIYSRRYNRIVIIEYLVNHKREFKKMIRLILYIYEFIPKYIY
ncbi:MAG: C2H2-type zinc finger protein [Promethearchaeota archaeon]